MNSQQIRPLCARVLLSLGVIAMVFGVLDALEGSVVILVGSGLVALGTWLGHHDRALATCRTWLFGMIAFGVIAMFVMSAMGGFGGETGVDSARTAPFLPVPAEWHTAAGGDGVRQVQGYEALVRHGLSMAAPSSPAAARPGPALRASRDGARVLGFGLGHRSSPAPRSLSFDGRELYFTSWRPDGYQCDLWVATREKAQGTRK